MTAAPALTVALVEDDDALREATAQALQLEGARVLAFRDARAALKALSRDFVGVVISDVRLPGMDGLEFFAQLREVDPDLPVIFTTAHGDVSMAVEAMKNGAVDFLAKPYAVAQLVRSARLAADKRKLVIENRRLRAELGQRAPRGIIGASDLAARLRSVVESVARSEIDVVVEGQAGTGKSFTARLIHDLSPRAGRPFVTLDSGIFAHEDADLLLFGREPNAGLSRTGLLERANGGTLLVDELHGIAETTRARLLAALENRSVLPMGADRPRQLNIRVIVTRNPDNSGAEAESSLPMEHRLGAVRIALPALAARREDIPEIFRRFVVAHEQELGVAPRPIGRAEWRHIQTNEWRGNLKELDAFARAFALGLSDIEPSPAAAPDQRSLQDIVADFERTVLEDALRRSGGNVADVQAMLQTPRKTVYDKLARYGLKPGAYRSGEPG